MNKENINRCDIVQDLLPLYYDDACSSESRRLVEEHLADCEKCQGIYEELKNNTIDSIIKEESKGVLERHEKKEKTAAYKTGIVIAGLLLIPILITFIVLLAGGMDLNVFAVITASMLLVAAITVVPLMSKQKRLVKCILTGVFALLLIFFFVDRMGGQGQFILWSVPTIFGLSIVFFPFIIRGVDLPPALADKKALITMLWDTLWLYLTIIEVCGHSGDLAGMKAGCIAATILMPGLWLIFLTARYLKKNLLVKSGIILWICGLWTVFSDDLYVLISKGTKHLTISHFDFSNWTELTINANICFITLLLGAVLIIAGLLRKSKTNGSNPA